MPVHAGLDAGLQGWCRADHLASPTVRLANFIIGARVSARQASMTGNQVLGVNGLRKHRVAPSAA